MNKKMSKTTIFVPIVQSYGNFGAFPSKHFSLWGVCLCVCVCVCVCVFINMVYFK
jgi:hypothetical protein